MGNCIGILLFDGVEELDFVGPWEVFTSAAAGRPDDRVVTIAETTVPVRCAKGLRVLPDHARSVQRAIEYDPAPPLRGRRLMFGLDACMGSSSV